MKILFIIDSLQRGGKERQFSYLIEGLLKTEHHIVLVSFDEESGFDVFLNDRITRYTLENRSRKNLSASKAIYRICRNEKPGVIHAWDTYSSLCAVLSSKLLRIPLINGSIRTTFIKQGFTGRIVSNLSYRLSGRVVANSYAGLLSAGKKSGRKFIVIHNGIILPEDTSEQNDASHTSVLMLANFSVFKDYDTLREAIEIILKELTQVRFLLVGYHVKKELETKLTDTIRPFVELHEGVAEPGRFLQQADIGVLSSHTEGLSNTVMEYMAYSKPVVATDVGAMAELVEHEKTGLLTKPSSAQDLASSIVLLIKEPERRRAMGEAGKRKLSEEFSQQKMIDNYLALYNELTKA